MKEEIEQSSDNLYADFGRKSPEEMQTKVTFAISSRNKAPYFLFERLMQKVLPLILTLLFWVQFSNSLEARLYFMHVPKTGGTTLRLLLELQLSNQEIYPYRNTKSKTRLVEENLVSGHFPYWFCKKLDGHFEEAFKVTILREPVERYLSLMRDKKKADIELPDLESFLRLRLSPSNKYREGMIDNALCRYLTDNPRLEGKALLESAKQTLEKFDCVIFFDNFAEDVVDLFQRLGIDLDKKDIPKINTTEPEAVSAQLLEELRQLNALDIQLYEYAKKHLSKKTTRCLLRTLSFESVIKKTVCVDYTFDFPLHGKGWTYREIWNGETIEHPIYRWVMNDPAEIYFWLEEGYDYILFFNAWSLSQEVIPQVNVNGKEIELVRLNTDIFSLYQGIISKDVITHDPTEITFYSNKAFQYRDFYPNKYNRNHPTLSFAINRIQIHRSPEVSKKYP